jgi:hypothetical protein
MGGLPSMIGELTALRRSKDRDFPGCPVASRITEAREAVEHGRFIGNVVVRSNWVGTGMRCRMIVTYLRFAVVAALCMGATAGAGAKATERTAPTTYRIQLHEIAVQATRSRRTDTNYAALAVRVGTTEPQILTRRMGDMGRGTKAVNMAFPRVAVRPSERLTVMWAVVNYGRETHAALLQSLRTATERQIRKGDATTWLEDLSDALSDVIVSGTHSCDGPVAASGYEIGGADLLRQSAAKPLRITRRQAGLAATARCRATSEYSVSIVITRSSAR